MSRMSSYSTSLPIAWPGVNFTPPDSGMWLEVRWFPNSPNNLHWENDAKQQYIGFLQVSVFARPGTGLVSPVSEAEGVQAHFPKGLVVGPVKVRKKPGVASSIDEGDRIQIPVSISYQGIDT